MQNVLGCVGGNATIRCAPEAAPAPEITWAFNDTNLGTLPDAQLSTTGQYEVCFNFYFMCIFAFSFWTRIIQKIIPLK